jgi:hypothetical protein
MGMFAETANVVYPVYRLPTKKNKLLFSVFAVFRIHRIRNILDLPHPVPFIILSDPDTAPDFGSSINSALLPHLLSFRISNNFVTYGETNLTKEEDGGGGGVGRRGKAIKR